VLPPSERDAARALFAGVPDLTSAFELRDCSPWNLLVAPDGGLGLLDWEGAEAQGTPLADLTYFLAYAAFFVEGTMHTGREPGSYRRMLDHGTPSGTIHAESVARYCAATGLAPDAVPALRLFCWLSHARTAEALRSSGPSGPTARFDADLFLALAREELRRAAAPSAQPERRRAGER
jgi:hypothetical protein